jgi:hypothetical protein
MQPHTETSIQEFKNPPSEAGLSFGVFMMIQKRTDRAFWIEFSACVVPVLWEVDAAENPVYVLVYVLEHFTLKLLGSGLIADGECSAHDSLLGVTRDLVDPCLRASSS